MQCNHMNTIYSIDKKLVKERADDLINSIHSTGRKIARQILKAGYGNWALGVDEYFKGREWNFFNRKPNGISTKQWRQKWLFDMGYYKHNKVGCGQCEICRVEKSKQWAVKGTCEAKVWKNKCFLTLTYNEPNLEANNYYINKADLQTFWKNLRYHLYKNTIEAKKIDLKQEYNEMQEIPDEIKLKYMISKRKPVNKPIRYIACNEYGEKKGRAHAHAVIFNFKPNDLVRHSRDRRGYYVYKSKKLSSIWGHGYVIVADVNANVAAYVARYNTKKFSKTSGIVNGTIKLLNDAYKNAIKDEAREILENHLKVWKERRESISASSLGYIGSYYWETNKNKIIEQKGIFVNWSKGVHLEKIPKPMEKQFEEEFPMEYDWYEYEKEKNGKEQWELILSKTSLSESEYIEQTFQQRMKKLKRLKRDYDEKPTCVTIYENH